MFQNAIVFNQNIGNWDTASVTDMNRMFRSTRNFNQNIGDWNTSRVTNMSAMFQDASAFNQNIGGWDTSRVTNMSAMFFTASVFNQNIGGWNTSRVTNMSAMFFSATAFNQDLSRWNVFLINTEPANFDLNTSSSWSDSHKPIWGTMGSTHASCYDPINAGTVGQVGWTGCMGMYIVADKAELESGRDGGYKFTLEGTDYSFADRDNNIFTGQVTDMSSLFNSKTTFNDEISAIGTLLG